jgi:hypothetical protein
MDGITYTGNNNTASYVITGGSIGGCDSTVYLNLTVNHTAYGVHTVTACGSYTWVDGNTYTANNNTATYIYTAHSPGGCDSIVTLDLTVLPAPSSVQTVTACEKFLWIDGITYTTSNQTAYYTFPGAGVNGCDSTVYLDLTILNTSNSTQTVQACHTFTWINGITYTADNHTASFTIPGGSSNGCDSTIHLDLTIPLIDNSVAQNGNNLMAVQSGATYQWIDCGTLAPLQGETAQSLGTTLPGNYAVVVTMGSCSDTSSCYSTGTTATDFVKEENRLEVFPNPCNGNFNIALDNEALITIYDLSGREVYVKQLMPGVNEVSLENEGNGIYVITTQGMNQKQAARLIINK